MGCNRAGRVQSIATETSLTVVELPMNYACLVYFICQFFFQLTFSLNF
jgi:hypothetical protein